MARVPKYAFRVVLMAVAAEGTRQENHNFETLVAAMTARDMYLRQRRTKKVELWMVLDESTPSHPV
jgi:hypothetical protein